MNAESFESSIPLGIDWVCSAVDVFWMLIALLFSIVSVYIDAWFIFVIQCNLNQIGKIFQPHHLRIGRYLFVLTNTLWDDIPQNCSFQLPKLFCLECICIMYLSLKHFSSHWRFYDLWSIITWPFIWPEFWNLACGLNISK